MATGTGNSKADKAFKEKQNKMTLMGKVLMRDNKHDKRSRRDRDSKVCSKDLEDEEDGSEVVAKQHWSSVMDKVLMRDRHNKVTKKDRESRIPSKDLEVVKVGKEDNEDSDVVAKQLNDVPKHHKYTLMDKVRMRHDKISKKERELKASSKGLDMFKSTSMGDLSMVDGSVQLRERSGRSHRKEKNRRSSSSVVKWVRSHQH